MICEITRGNWKVEFVEGDKPYVVADQGVGWANPVICDLYEDVTPEDSVTMGAWLKALPNAHGNARLIAEAPAMLEIIEEFLGYASAGFLDEIPRFAPDCFQHEITRPAVELLARLGRSPK